MISLLLSSCWCICVLTDARFVKVRLFEGWDDDNDRDRVLQILVLPFTAYPHTPDYFEFYGRYLGFQKSLKALPALIFDG